MYPVPGLRAMAYSVTKALAAHAPLKMTYRLLYSAAGLKLAAGTPDLYVGAPLGGSQYSLLAVAQVSASA